MTLTWQELSELPTVEVTQDIHCVTRWSRFDTAFSGVPWSRPRASSSGSEPTARFAVAHAEAGFTSNVPIEFLEREGAMLATHADGEPLTAEHGWPLRLVVPGKYFWKSAKWLRGIELRRRGSAGLLGAARLPQRGGSVPGAALRLLSPPADHSNGGRAGGTAADE